MLLGPEVMSPCISDISNLCLLCFFSWLQEAQGQEDPPEKGMATHSNILAWRIQWTEEPGGLQSMGSQESDTTERGTHCFLVTLTRGLSVSLTFPKSAFHFIDFLYPFPCFQFY